MIITIDGPSGSGKTTLSLALAKELHFFCMNSGYIYRGLVYVLKTFYGYDEQKINNPDLNDIAAILQSGKFEYRYEYGLTKIVWIDEITPFLKDAEISRLAALVAKNHQVQEIIHIFERSLVAQKDSVVEGRACGSAIYPNAEIKFYIDAPTSIRANRLVKDQAARGVEIAYDQALQQIQARDYADMNRPVEPLVVPRDAIILDSAAMDSKQLLAHVLHHVAKIIKKGF